MCHRVRDRPLFVALPHVRHPRLTRSRMLPWMGESIVRILSSGDWLCLSRACRCRSAAVAMPLATAELQAGLRMVLLRVAVISGSPAQERTRCAAWTKLCLLGASDTLMNTHDELVFLLLY